ncbi:inositol-phosphate phosphatase [Ochromonadaceae sp. CCMP2298]|nr:inositol-phosphate phosphatase [Ochromonadaceae sp. CCMP2298]
MAIANVAEQAARLAGAAILTGSGSIDLSCDIESKIGSRDIVTEVDKRAQDLIQQVIHQAFPDHVFLGEEDVAPGAEASAQAVSRLANEEHLWIVDPIDGTTNFAHGMPLSGVIIAYASKGVCVFGLIFDPFRDEMFVSWRGKGAHMNGKQIKCCSTPDLSGAVVATGSPPNLAALAACLRATELISPKVRTVRMLGSAAVMLSWVAMGRLTAYFEADLNVWDLAAGALMIEEAGGRVTDAHGGRFELTTRNLVATNGKIHDALLVDMVDSEMWIK